MLLQATRLFGTLVILGRNLIIATGLALYSYDPTPDSEVKVPSLDSGFVFQHVATQGLKAWIQHSHFITQTRQELNSFHITVSFLRVLQHTRLGPIYKSAFIAVSIKRKRVPH